MTGPPDLWLDGDPREPLRPQPERQALGRDPFADPIEADPSLDRVARARPRRGGDAVRRAPRLDELGPPVDPLGGPRWQRGIDPRRIEALEHLTPPGRGRDAFGLDPEALRGALPFALRLYRHWFRVTSEGHENLPSEGPVILAANHGGLLPFDGAMGVLDVLLHTDPPRVPRALVDRFVDKLPWLPQLYARLGQVSATRRNFRELLRRDQMVLVFPEGVDGIRKPVSQRYRLQPFRPGFAEEAIRAGVPIVPVAFLGPDDQAPVLFDVQPLARALRLPAAPITPTFPWLGPLGLLPLPVRYRIAYGEPIRPDDELGPEAASDPDAVRELSTHVRRTIQRMIDARR